MPHSRLFACAAAACVLALAAPTLAEAQGGGSTAAAGRGVAVKPVWRAVGFTTQAPAAGGLLVLPLSGEADLASRAASLTEADRVAVARALTSADFSYDARKTLTLRGIGAWDMILVVGLGEAPQAKAYQSAAGLSFTHVLRPGGEPSSNQ